MTRLLAVAAGLALLTGCGASSSGGGATPEVSPVTAVHGLSDYGSVQKIIVDGTPCIVAYTDYRDGGLAISCDWSTPTPSPEATP